MISKQDGLHARTPSELERRYNFGKSFSEIMGYATNAQKAAETAQDAADAAQNAADKANQAFDGLNQEAIFNLLTDNGKAKGVYRDEDGEIYINASYIKTGVFLADLIKAGVLQSGDGTTFYLDLENGILKMNATELTIGSSKKQVGDIAEEVANEKADGALNSAKEYADGTLDSAKEYADQYSIDNVSQTEIFNKLTNNGTIQGLFMENGQLYINASYISSVEAMFAKDIYMSGKFRSNGENYLPPTYEDITRILQASLFPDRYTEYELQCFDLNGDGDVTIADVQLALDVYNGNVSMSDCPGAITMLANIIIDMSVPDEAIKIVGTNQFGSDVDIVIGLDPSKCSFAQKKHLDRMMQLDYKTGCLYRLLDTGEKEWHNPPMVVGEEYRTSERWGEKPVYRKLISHVFSSVSSSGSDDVPHGIANLDKMLRCVPHTDGYIFPVVYSGQSSTVTRYDAANIQVTNAEWPWDESRVWHFDMYYTKIE